MNVSKTNPQFFGDGRYFPPELIKTKIFSVKNVGLDFESVVEIICESSRFLRIGLVLKVDYVSINVWGSRKLDFNNV